MSKYKNSENHTIIQIFAFLITYKVRMFTSERNTSRNLLTLYYLPNISKDIMKIFPCNLEEQFQRENNPAFFLKEFRF